MDFDLVKRGLIVTGKQKFTRTMKSGCDTSMRFGDGAEIIKVYDKANQLGEEQARTRIEIQLTQGKLPVRSFYDLIRCGATDTLECLTQPFTNIKLFKIDFVNPYDPNRAVNSAASLRLETLVSAIGIDEARKRLNQQRHFERDFGQLYICTPLVDIREYAENSMRDFFTCIRSSQFGKIRPCTR